MSLLNQWQLVACRGSRPVPLPSSCGIGDGNARLPCSDTCSGLTPAPLALKTSTCKGKVTDPEGREVALGLGHLLSRDRAPPRGMHEV